MSARLVPDKQNNWRTLVVNCNGVIGKKAQLANLVSYTDPDVLIVTETKIDGTVSSAEFIPPGYKSFRKDRKMGGGGVLIALKSKYPAEEVDIRTDCELIWVKISLRQQRTLYTGAFYRPPSDTIYSLEELNRSLEQLALKTKNNKNSTIILGGDFNTGEIDWDTLSVKPGSPQKVINEKVVDILDEHHLTQVHREPTREGRLLDLLCTNNPSLTKTSNTIPGISDHDVILTDSYLRPQFVKTPPRKIRLFSKADWTKLKEETDEFAKQYAEVHESRTVEENWNAIRDHIDQIIDKFVPAKNISVRYHLPWLTAELKRMCKRKCRMFIKARKSKKHSDWEKFKDYKRFVANEIKKAHWQYLNEILSTSLEENNSKPFWRYIKSQ